MLKVTWLGCAFIHITDGQQALLFDPFVTRPGFFKVATFQELKTDELKVDKAVGYLPAGKVGGIFASHNHYDHVLDLVSFSKKTGGPVYGSISTKNIALGGGVKPENIHSISENTPVQIGKFKITPIKGMHPPQLLGINFFEGKINKPLKPPAAVSEYRQGQNWNFLIEYENKKILFHPSAHPSQLIGFQADLVILGIASRKSTIDLIQRVLQPVQAKAVMPVHYDNFFSKFKRGFAHLSFVNFKEFKKTITNQLPHMKFVEETVYEF